MHSNMTTSKICLGLLCLLTFRSVGMPQYSGATFFMKEIKLTKGQVALVDDEDFEYLNQWKWFAHVRRDRYYAARSDWSNRPKSKTISMHRVILGITNPKLFGDHKNHNTLDKPKA